MSDGSTTGDAPLDAATLRRALRAAAELLIEHAPAVDAINVYPVPDGDTGTNMAGTFADAVASLPEEPQTVAELLEALARAALLSARGNSGVILSQALRGLAEGAAGADRLDGPALASALAAAASGAYAAVAEPVEGTMLTVLRRAAEAAAEAAERGGSCTAVLEAAADAAERAEEETPELLPILREAGVPDAGGEGVCVLLRGLVAALAGVAPPPRRPLPPPRHVPHEERVGFCVECLLESEDGKPDIVRQQLLGAGAKSVVITGSPPLHHVHFHAPDPDPLLQLLERSGRVSRVKVEDMSAQYRRFLTEGSGATARVALLALSPTPALDELFRTVGAETFRASPLSKPTVSDILAAAEALHQPDVIVLPNHRDLVLTVQQAASLARRCTLHLVPAVTVPEGVAAALAFVPERPLPDLLGQMSRARERVRTIEVTRATGERTFADLRIRPGEFVALLDGRPVASERKAAASALAALDASPPPEGALVTLYRGAELPEEELAELAERIAARWPGAELERVESGHELYPLIIGVE